MTIPRANLRPFEPRRVALRTWAPALAVLLLAAAAPAPASATVVLPADFAEMVSESQIIVHGRVADVRAHITGDRQSIETLVTVSVSQSLKGDAGAAVVFRVPNGQVGRYRRVTVGAPEFTAGDEVVVFLKGRPPVVPMPYGLNQGVYRVERPARGRAIVAPAPVLARGGDAERLVRGDPARHGVAIDDFVGQVLALQGPPGRSAVPAPRGGAAGAAAGSARPRTGGQR